MATAKKLPSGSWRIQIFDYVDSNGKKHYKSFTSKDKTKAGKKEVEQMALDYLNALNKVVCPKPSLILRDAVDSYIEEKRPVFSPATIRGYKNASAIIERTTNRLWLSNLSDIDSQALQNAISTWTQADKSPKTVRNYVGLISAVMKWNGYSLPVVKLPQKVTYDRSIPTDEDIKTLINKSRGTSLYVPILLAAFGMMRRSEICAADIKDLKGNVLHVKKAIVLGDDLELHEKTTKSVKSDRFVTLPDFVADEIRRQGYITKVKPNTITKEFIDLQVRNNLPRFRFHDLRHYSASIRHALGIPDAYIMEEGGWSSDVVLKSVYRHALDDKAQEMAEMANSYFTDLGKGE